jgi:spore coat protein U-like protein
MNCSFAFNPTSQATLLSLTSATPQRIQVGTVVQQCSGNGSYSLIVASVNCVIIPIGAELVEPVTQKGVNYSVEFNNPTTGGSQPVVTGLLAKTCLNAVGRDVHSAKIQNESSAVYINFTGSAALAAGTYSDTLSVTLNIH